MMAKPFFSPAASPWSFLLAAAFFLLPVEHGHAWPHMTQQRMPSGRLTACFCDIWAGKFTKLVNSGTVAFWYFSISPWNFEGIGGFMGTHFRFDWVMSIGDI